MRWLWEILLVIFFVCSLQAQTIYKWVDKNGVINFTDDFEKVPPAFRDQVQKTELKEEQMDVKRLGPPPVSPFSQPLTEKKETDKYGRDEAWWREKVSPWKKQLKEATQGLEEVQKRFSERTAEMRRKGLVSRARYQTEAEKYDREKKKYEAQIAEAREMLEKLSKEAEESNANLEWLK